MAFTNQKTVRNYINIIKFFFNRKYASTILSKIYSKFFDPKPQLSNKENLEQISKNKISSPFTEYRVEFKNGPSSAANKLHIEFICAIKLP